MIQIPLVCDLHISSGDVPRLEFQDVKQAEKFIADFQNRIDVIKERKKQRLEFFDDGIYFDGEYLDLSPKHTALLRAFEFIDRVSKIDLVYKVWNNSRIHENTVSSTICHLNKKLKDKDIFVYYDNGHYVIHRPG